MRYIIFIFCFISLSIGGRTEAAMAQSNLDKVVTLNVKQVKLSALLTLVAKKGNFYFSYSSDQLKADSLVSFSVVNKPVRNLLDELFNGNVDYKESAGYIILRSAPKRLTLKPDTSYGKDYNYYISGYVIDDHTGLPIPNASVYEKRLLVATLTNDKGYFSLRLKSDGQVVLTVSKEQYKDASVSFLNDVTISLNHRNVYYSADTTSGGVARNWLGRIFISSKQRIQNINLGGYMASVPFQTSFIPGLSTHGMMSSQVVNHYSINVLGGYTAGLDGIEFGGLFNINKQNVRYLQAAGLFNIVGGNFKGVQLAGIGNTVLKNAKGLQAAGIYNIVKDTLEGVQAAGVFNRVGGSFEGVQLAGIGNAVLKNANGLQAAGIFNTVKDTLKGVQLAAIFNKSRVLKGVSISPVNITDTLNGYAIGLLNLSRNGYHKILIYSNEITTVNAGFKTGNAKLYSIISVGANFTNAVKFYSVGFGIGHDFLLSNRYYISAELATQSLVSNRWDNWQQVNKFSTLINIKASSKLTFFAGPSLNFYNEMKDENSVSAGQQYINNETGLISLKNGKSWIGWSAGIAF